VQETKAGQSLQTARSGGQHEARDLANPRLKWSVELWQQCPRPKDQSDQVIEGGSDRFAVVAAASLTFTIIMFTQKSDLEAAAEQAQRQARDERKSLGKPDRIWLRCQGGHRQEAESLADIKSVIDAIRKTVADDPDVKTTKMPADLPVAAMLDGLYKHFRKTARRKQVQATATT